MAILASIHTISFTICRLEADSSERFETFQLAPGDLDRFCLGRDADDEVAVEATGNTAWFCDEIRACVGRIVVINPPRFQAIRQSVKKTDRNDARGLATFLARDMLPETRLKRPAETELASLAQTRDMLVKSRTRLFNNIHAIFYRNDVKLKREAMTDKRLRGLETGRFSRLEQVELEVLRDEALRLNTTICQLDQTVADAASKLAGFAELTSIKGIGARAAALHTGATALMPSGGDFFLRQSFIYLFRPED